MKFNFNISLWAFVSAYAIVNGLIYSWAFWSSFKVNILQYVSIYDLLASIIYLIAGPSVIFIIYSIIVQVGFSVTPSSSPAQASTPDSTKKQSSNKFVLKLKRILNATSNLLTVIAYYAMTISTYNESIGYKKIIVLFLIFLPIMILLLNETSYVLKDKIPFNNVVLSIFIAAPFYLFLNAKSQADDIINGRDTFIVNSDSGCLENNKFRYISTVGDKAFAISLTDNSLCVFKYNYVKLIDEKTSISVNAMPKDML